MTTAIIYARVSSVKQRDKGIPVESQLDRARAKAAEMGVTVLREFVDGGRSGRKSSRPEFMAAIEFCGLMDVKYFITWDTKRFARNKLDAAVLKHDLRKGGTSLVYVSQDIDVATDDGWFLEGLFELLDERESRNIGKDTKRSLMKNARDGFFNGGAVPFGYQVVPEGKRRRLQIQELEADVVRRIFAECLQGSGIKTIALMLNQAGLYRRGVKWSKNTVGYLLRSWTYAGYITFNRMNRAEGTLRPETDWIRTLAHPPIISEVDFKRVQAQLDGRASAEASSSPLSRHVFTGILRCGACGMGMQVETARGRSATYSYYNCGAAVRGTGCRNRRMRTSIIDQDLLEFLMKRLINRDRMEDLAGEIHQLKGEWVKQRVGRREVLVNELRAVERRRDNLLELLELHGKGAPNLGDLTDRLHAHKSRIRAIEGDLDALELAEPPEASASAAELDQVAGFMQETITKCENPKKVREFLATFIEKIVMDGQHAVIHYNPARLVNARPVAAVHSSRKWLPDLVTLRTEVLRMRLPERYRMAA